MPEACPPPPSKLPRLRRSDLLAPGRFDLVRLYRAQGAHAAAWNELRHFGPLASMRFDHHPEPPATHPRHAVMYAAAGRPPSGCDPLDVAVLETFADTGVVPVTAPAHWLAIWRPVRALRLLDLSGSAWIARAGGNAALTSGARAVARRWATAIWEQYDVDGLAWGSAVLPPGRAVVLFERAASVLPAHPRINVPLSHPGLLPALARISRDYGLILR